MDEDIFSLLNTHSLTDLRSQLTNLITPSIRLQGHILEEGSNLQKGSSRMGGHPDLPKGMRWPRFNGTAMSFLAQINLSDLAKYNNSNVLPGHGLLSFFFDEEYDSLEPSSSQSDHKGWQVHYFTDDFSLLRHAKPPTSFSEEQLFPPRSLVFASSTTLPARVSPLVDALHLSSDKAERYIQLVDQVTKRSYGSIYQGVHQLLGHPYALQGDVFLEAVRTMRRIADWDVDLENGIVAKEMREAIREWKLLLQIDMRGTGHPVWSGCIFYFLQPSSALAASDFSQTWLVIQCD